MPTSLLHRFEHRTKAAPDVKHTHSWLDTDPLKNIVVFIPLRLSERLGKIPLKHGTGQVSMFTKAQTENLIHEIIGFFDLLLIGHECPLSRCSLALLSFQSISLKSIPQGWAKG